MKLSFTVVGVPCPKPRMTQADKWKKRPCVLRWWAWADAVRLAWYAVRPQGWKPLKGDVSVTAYFCVSGRGDIDNLFKGVLDILQGQGYPYANDRQVTRVEAEIIRVNKGHESVEVSITERTGL